MGKTVIILASASLLGVALIAALTVVFIPTGSPENLDEDPLQSKPCMLRQYEFDSYVCVCNSTYCDTVVPPPDLNPGEIVCYTSTKSGLRFAHKMLLFNDSNTQAETSFTIDLKSTKKFQRIHGFGGAFTDAAGMNILSLSQSTQQHYFTSMFSDNGIEFNIARIPMASCDFSTRLYTYADEPDDFEMEKFALQEEDFQLKIPLIKRAQAMSKQPIKLFASPWSAPAWMKTNDELYGSGFLKGEAGGDYYKAWALYYARFAEEYERNGVPLWGFTAQNEPSAAFGEDFPFQCMGYTPEQQRDFVKIDLGPTLEARGHGGLKLIIGDGQRPIVPSYANAVLNDTEAAKYVDGMGVHWYMDFVTNPQILTDLHNSYPDYFILGTEACAGYIPFSPSHVKLGDWFRGQRYSADIIRDLNNWVTGWVDWNLALDLEGGPNWVENFVDAPIIVDSNKDEFYKQPMYYHFGHISKFLPEGSTRIEVQGPIENRSLVFTAFYDDTNNKIILIILNTSDSAINASIKDVALGQADIEIPAFSIQTFLWKAKL